MLHHLRNCIAGFGSKLNTYLLHVVSRVRDNDGNTDYLI